MGVIVETTVHRHLYSFYYRDTPEIVYWRDLATDKEVDIIVRSPNYIIPFEVKYREHPKLSASSGLVAYCRLEKQVKRAYWVTKQDNDFGVTTFKELEDEHGEQTQFLKIPARPLLPARPGGGCCCGRSKDTEGWLATVPRWRGIKGVKCGNRWHLSAFC